LRRALRWAAYVRGQRCEDQLADVLQRFAPSLRPWTRCVVCNGLLEAVDVEEVADQLQPGTLRTYSEYVRCTLCGRPFWRGAHARRLQAVVAAALDVARAAQPPAAPG
ncbi:MAG TPA: Mut7-C RNAse domain-containing protein, partial [Kineosporiaceae bacterium]|nr:Mut7-C RNAse domain-containing protein [Kineosporiaceae bacterium]